MKCDCGQVCAKRTVRGGNNAGRQFFTCDQPEDTKCSFFAWHSQTTPRTRGGNVRPRVTFCQPPFQRLFFQVTTSVLPPTLLTIPGMRQSDTETYVFPMKSYQQVLFALGDTCEMIPDWVRRMVLSEPDFAMSHEEVKASIDSLPDTVLPYQKEGIGFALQCGGRCLFGDEMGLGKSLQALFTFTFYRNEWPVLIVCPSSLRYAWRDQAIQWLHLQRSDIHVVASSKDNPRKDAQIVIISYDMLRRNHAKFGHRASDGRSFMVVIVDECHFIKDSMTQRTKVVQQVCKAAHRCLMLSGTPAVNRAIELYAQLVALIPTLMPSFTQYAERYCDKEVQNFGRRQVEKWVGAKRQEELHTILTSCCMIRRRKVDVLTQLPPKRRMKVSLDDQKMDQSKLKLVKAQIGGVDFDPNEPTQQVTQLFKQTAEAKIDAVLDYLEYLLDCGEQKMLVFAHHYCVLDRVREMMEQSRIGHVHIDGRTSQIKRPEYVKQFQEDPTCRVAVLSITACGTGLTLTAASLVIFAELYWVPGQLQQAEDRAHRIGQHTMVTVQYLIAEKTLDERMFDSINKKALDTSGILDGKHGKKDMRVETPCNGYVPSLAQTPRQEDEPDGGLDESSRALQQLLAKKAPMEVTLPAADVPHRPHQVLGITPSRKRQMAAAKNGGKIDTPGAVKDDTVRVNVGGDGAINSNTACVNVCGEAAMEAGDKVGKVASGVMTMDDTERDHVTRAEGGESRGVMAMDYAECDHVAHAEGEKDLAIPATPKRDVSHFRTPTPTRGRHRAKMSEPSAKRHNTPATGSTARVGNELTPGSYFGDVPPDVNLPPNETFAFSSSTLGDLYRRFVAKVRQMNRSAPAQSPENDPHIGRWFVVQYQSLVRSLRLSGMLQPAVLVERAARRYIVECVGKKSVLRRLMEDDDFPQGGAVLDVVTVPSTLHAGDDAKTPMAPGIKGVSPSGTLGVTDGWYTVPCEANSHLLPYLVEGARIRVMEVTRVADSAPGVGVHLGTCVTLNGKVRLHLNATSFEHGKLGRRTVHPGCLRIMDVHQEGGLISRMDVTCVRMLPAVSHDDHRMLCVDTFIETPTEAMFFIVTYAPPPVTTGDIRPGTRIILSKVHPFTCSNGYMSIRAPRHECLRVLPMATSDTWNPPIFPTDRATRSTPGGDQHFTQRAKTGNIVDLRGIVLHSVEGDIPIVYVLCTPHNLLCAVSCTAPVDAPLGQSIQWDTVRFRSHHGSPLGDMFHFTACGPLCVTSCEFTAGTSLDEWRAQLSRLVPLAPDLAVEKNGAGENASNAPTPKDAAQRDQIGTTPQFGGSCLTARGAQGCVSDLGAKASTSVPEVCPATPACGSVCGDRAKSSTACAAPTPNYNPMHRGPTPVSSQPTTPTVAPCNTAPRGPVTPRFINLPTTPPVAPGTTAAVDPLHATLQPSKPIPTVASFVHTEDTAPSRPDNETGAAPLPPGAAPLPPAAATVPPSAAQASVNATARTRANGACKRVIDCTFDSPIVQKRRK